MTQPSAMDPLFAPLGGPFQKALNELMGPDQIQYTAQKFQAFLATKGDYKMGEWANTLIPDASKWGSQMLFDGWKKFCGEIPPYMQAAVQQTIKSNLTSPKPLPMSFLIVPANRINPKHTLELNSIADEKGVEHILITIKCP
jgi:hypothetical protein